MFYGWRFRVKALQIVFRLCALFVLLAITACGAQNSVVANFDGNCDGLEGPGAVVGIDIATGAVLWERTIGDATGVALADGVVVGAGSSGVAFGADASSGNLLWCEDFGRVAQDGNIVMPGFAASGGVVATAVAGGDVVGLEPQSGRQLWRTSLGLVEGLHVGAGSGTFEVRHLEAADQHLFNLDAMTGTEIENDSRPETNGEHLLVVDNPYVENRQVVDVSVLRDGRELWSERLPGFVASLHRDAVVVIDQTGGTGSFDDDRGDTDTRITAYEASTGVRRWQVPLPGTPHLTAEAGSMIVVPTGTMLRAIDSQSGEIVWSSDPGSPGRG
ncbi:MAG: PQQ-binding-like beta-propeller repeat protein, partial [Acidimicrobiales bacterium]